MRLDHRRAAWQTTGEDRQAPMTKLLTHDHYETRVEISNAANKLADERGKPPEEIEA